MAKPTRFVMLHRTVVYLAQASVFAGDTTRSRDERKTSAEVNAEVDALEAAGFEHEEDNPEYLTFVKFGEDGGPKKQEPA